MQKLMVLILGLIFSACSTTKEMHLRVNIPRDERTSLQWQEIFYDFRYELRDILGVRLGQDKRVVDQKFTVDGFTLEGYKWIPLYSGNVEVLYIRPPAQYNWTLLRGRVLYPTRYDSRGPHCLAIWKDSGLVTVYRIECAYMYAVD